MPPCGMHVAVLLVTCERLFRLAKTGQCIFRQARDKASAKRDSVAMDLVGSGMTRDLLILLRRCWNHNEYVRNAGMNSNIADAFRRPHNSLLNWPAIFGKHVRHARIQQPHQSTDLFELGNLRSQ